VTSALKSSRRKNCSGANPISASMNMRWEAREARKRAARSLRARVISASLARRSKSTRMPRAMHVACSLQHRIDIGHGQLAAIAGRRDHDMRLIGRVRLIGQTFVSRAGMEGATIANCRAAQNSYLRRRVFEQFTGFLLLFVCG
jgi:hypothetical protein